MAFKYSVIFTSSKVNVMTLVVRQISIIVLKVYVCADFMLRPKKSAGRFLN